MDTLLASLMADKWIKMKIKPVGQHNALAQDLQEIDERLQRLAGLIVKALDNSGYPTDENGNYEVRLYNTGMARVAKGILEHYMFQVVSEEELD